MSAATVGDEGGQSQVGLFGEEERPEPCAVNGPKQAGGPARVMSAQRHQVELRPVHLDALLAPDHAAGTVREHLAFLQAGSVTAMAGEREPGTPKSALPFPQLCPRFRLDVKAPQRTLPEEKNPVGRGFSL